MRDKEPKGPLDYQVGGDHYRRYKYQPIELIADLGLGFERGNAVKYLARLGHKGDPLEDLAKVRHYLDFFEKRRNRFIEKLDEFTDQIKNPTISLAISAVCTGDLRLAREMVDLLEEDFRKEGNSPERG